MVLSAIWIGCLRSQASTVESCRCSSNLGPRQSQRGFGKLKTWSNLCLLDCFSGISFALWAELLLPFESRFSGRFWSDSLFTDSVQFQIKHFYLYMQILVSRGFLQNCQFFCPRLLASQKGNAPLISISLPGTARARQTSPRESKFSEFRGRPKSSATQPTPTDKELTNSWRPLGNATSTISTVLNRVDTIIWEWPVDRSFGKGLHVQRTLQGAGAIFRITRDDRLFGLKRDRLALFCGERRMRFIVGQYNLFYSFPRKRMGSGHHKLYDNLWRRMCRCRQAEN